MLTVLSVIALIHLFTLCISASYAGRIPAREQAWQYRWQVWLPDKWRRVANCETHLDWAHDSRGRNHYVSAFGIEAGEYVKDAHFAGTPQWWRRPTPWQQFRTALAHYALNFGFSGWGCRGA